MCGRRKLEKDSPELCSWGDMDFKLLNKLAKEIPENIIIQFHNNGEPLLYPRLSEALDLFPNNIKCLNTNAKLLSRTEIRECIKKKLNTLTISVIENDSEEDKQLSTVFQFLNNKDFQSPPLIIFRLLGNVKNRDKWEVLAKIHNCIIATRILHNPLGSFGYEKKVTIPEYGICLDLLTHLVIDRYGDVFPCVRMDYKKYNLLGNIKNNTLEELWNCDKRKNFIKEHIRGNRNCSILCSKCDFYGCPTGK
jgi:radical SAM protein with 4Fe4S-binding SPASM domain